MGNAVEMLKGRSFVRLLLSGTYTLFNRSHAEVETESHVLGGYGVGFAFDLLCFAFSRVSVMVISFNAALLLPYCTPHLLYLLNTYPSYLSTFALLQVMVCTVEHFSVSYAASVLMALFYILTYAC